MHGQQDLLKASFPFLRLPSELRNLVYGFALYELQKTDWLYGTPRNALRPPCSAKGGNICITGRGPLRSDPVTRHSPPKLLQVNRQIREEAAKSYYRDNELEFYIPGTEFDFYYDFLEAIGSCSKLIATITLRMYGMGYRSGAMEDYNPVEYEDIRARHLSKDCVVKFKGYPRMVQQIRARNKIVVDLRAFGLEREVIARIVSHVRELESLIARPDSEFHGQMNDTSDDEYYWATDYEDES